jgi:uncharacterized protein
MIKSTLIFAASLALLITPPAFTATEVGSSDRERVAKLHVVDCLLPGQVRQLGQRTYLTPRRPIRTTAADCEIRGGEYVSFDRADYQTALKVWMEAAKAGDAEAQTNVGEIFEKGLGTTPNYAAAALWYEKAAKQGNTRAQFNLGTLYELGRGVPLSKLEALNWYRRAWGMAEDDLMFSSAAAREQESLQAELEQSLAEKNAQLGLLRNQVSELRKKLDAVSQTESAARNAVQAQASALESLIAQIETQKTETTQRLSGMPKTREPVMRIVKEQSEAAKQIKPRMYRDLELGRYFALLIGNANYSALDDLDTPLSDIARAKQILEEQYGFTVVTIEDGNNIELMEAINDLYALLGENDNLLLFYAGHGNRLSTGGTEIGYWLPANAEPPPRNTFWVANEFISGHLSRLKAKRILVVADSCYSGLLSTEPTFLLLGDSAPRYDNTDFFKIKLKKRSRLLLSSGGDRPVLDGGGGNNSVFAKAFFDELEQNKDLLAAPQLYLKVKDRVTLAAQAVDFDQEPDFKTIKAAGHEVGDFFFVPKELR